MASLLKSLAVSVVALSTAPALAQSNAFNGGEIDWSEVTGSIASSPGPFFQLAPILAPTDGAVTTLQRLPADARQLRFEGEMGRRDIPVYVRKDAINDAARLKLRFINSVAVMPEASRLVVSINDKQLAEIALDAAGEIANVDLPIPVGLLEPGYNAISFAVQQRHRVDCSIEAANELWTQIDTSVSGLSITTPGDAISSFEDLNAVPVGEDGATAITIVLPPGADNTLIDQSIRAAQALAVRAGINRPKVAFARESSTAPGIHLYVGTTADLRSRGIDLNPFGDSAFNVAGRASSIVRVTVSGATSSDVNQNIFRLVVERPNKDEMGTQAGLRARTAQRGYRIEPETEVSLADIGLASQDFSGRVYQATFNIVMPPDFYPADNGKATLFLDGEYVAGLSSSNEALVRINGKVAGAVRLARSGGDTLTRRPVDVTLKSLNAGFNTVTLEVRTASDEDKDCNPLALLEPHKRLTVNDTTAFAIPKISRIFNLPNLSASANTGFPFTESKKPLTIFMPKPDLAALGAAATLLVKSAVAAGRPFETRMSSKAPDAASDSALIVGALRDLSPDMVDYFGIKTDMVPATWPRPAALRPAQDKPAIKEAAKTTDKPLAAKQVAAPVQPSIFGPAPGTAPVFGAPQATEKEAALTQPFPDDAGDKKDFKKQWGEKAEDLTRLEKFRQGLSSFLQRNIGYTSDQLSFLHGDRSAITATRNAKLVLAQQQSMAGGSATWMLLTGPDSATIQRETTGLISHTAWSQMQGRMVAYDPGETQMTVWPEGQHYHYDMREWTPSNVTLVAAGWLSNHIQYYVLVILVICAFFGLFTRKLLNRIGAQP